MFDVLFDVQDHQNHPQDHQNHPKGGPGNPVCGSGGPGGGSGGPGGGPGGPGGVGEQTIHRVGCKQTIHRAGCTCPTTKLQMDRMSTETIVQGRDPDRDLRNKLFYNTMIGVGDV